MQKCNKNQKEILEVNRTQSLCEYEGLVTFPLRKQNGCFRFISSNLIKNVICQ